MYCVLFSMGYCIFFNCTTEKRKIKHGAWWKAFHSWYFCGLAAHLLVSQTIYQTIQLCWLAHQPAKGAQKSIWSQDLRLHVIKCLPHKEGKRRIVIMMQTQTLLIFTYIIHSSHLRPSSLTLVLFDWLILQLTSAHLSQVLTLTW